MVEASWTQWTQPICTALGLKAPSVRAVLQLSATGATVPFISRYRKEATAGLDEVQVQQIVEHSQALTLLQARRETILKQLSSVRDLDPEVLRRIENAATREQLEDLYLPYKPQRRTRAAAARERGLEPLARSLWHPGPKSPREAAQRFVNVARGVPNVDDALAGARDLCAERLANNANLRQQVRTLYLRHARVSVIKSPKTRSQVTPFDHHVCSNCRLESIAPHRWLAWCRGEAEGALQLKFTFDSDNLQRTSRRQLGRAQHPEWETLSGQWIKDAYARLLVPAAKNDARQRLHDRAQRSSLQVFAQNLKQLLLAPPLGAHPVLGIDPGQRTGCKCALINARGQLVRHETVYLLHGADNKQKAVTSLRSFLCEVPKLAVAVGNGTHGRETLEFVREVLAGDEQFASSFCVSVNETGASVYSASEVARKEFPKLDLTYRGAVSIARRLQDPLAELVKINPKSLGVGQYQHDVDAAQLESRLANVVESCVHSVGVDLNTASSQLLEHVSGLGPKLANSIVQYRHDKGRFRSREQLLSVQGLGPRSYELSAGFLRVRDGDNPLDATAVHPESYAAVKTLAGHLGRRVSELLGNVERLHASEVQRLLLDEVGEFTSHDILEELSRPGRDPRRDFTPPSFTEGIASIDQLCAGMKLTGMVTNVAAFGAFVDLGVHQDGLIHISKLADGYVKDATDEVHVGQEVTVLVLEVDTSRRRISLSRVADELNP